MDADTRARNARVKALGDTLGWQDLREILAGAEEKYWKHHIAVVRSGKQLDPVELARAMGKLDGIRAILSAPDKAATILSREHEEEKTA